MQELSAMESDVFPKEMRSLPQAPRAEEVEKDPALAVCTYLHQDCFSKDEKGTDDNEKFFSYICFRCFTFC